MFAGLFVSKFSMEGLERLGFSTYREAYNAMGYALGGKPTSIKNYQQEFDPLFPGGRKGWHGREVRAHCREAFDRYGGLSMDEFLRMLRPLLVRPAGKPKLPRSLTEIAELDDDNLDNETVCKRLITGAAAERFFESAFPSLSEFRGHSIANVTRFGCGFDFRIQASNSDRFLAAEVKGISGAVGEVTMTQKEHRVAKYLRDRYYLCVVRNFADCPVLSIFRNPLEQVLEFVQREHQQTILTWHTRVPA